MSGRHMLLLCMLTLCACKKPSQERPAELAVTDPEEERAQPGDEVQPHAPVTPTPTPSDEPPTAAQLPVAEDFQAETATTIIRANYHKELDALEGEMRADEH
jgi:hypothetical protein